MEKESAIKIGNQLISRISPACKSALIDSMILNKKKQIKGINIAVIPSDRKLLDALLFECSTPIKSSSTILHRLYQNVDVQIMLR